MGYPEKTETLKKFYPTSTLVTGFDILFFWVARMMMMGIKFMDDVPFKDVYLHALVRDEHGQKMSKSKGNVIDPLIMIEKYGADAFRFALAIFTAQGRDIKLNADRIEGYRNFINKIWNAARFIFMNMPDTMPSLDTKNLADEDKWILMKLEKTAKAVSASIENYAFNEGASELYQFFWMTFCDWYLEIIKERLFKGEGKSEEQAIATAAFVLEKSMIAMHPYIPFVTEHIYKALTGKETIMYEAYPDDLAFGFSEAEANIDSAIELINLVRNIRGEYNIAPNVMTELYITSSGSEKLHNFEKAEGIIKKAAKVSEIHKNIAAPDDSAIGVGTGFEIKIPLTKTIDADEERSRLEKEKKAAEKDFNLYGGKLQNKRYLEKAPAEVIEKDRKIFEEAKAKLEKINEALSKLNK